jgi:VWFA-related protein
MRGLAFAALFLSAVGFRAAPAIQQHRLAVEGVRVDVFVSDGGLPLTGLTRADFMLSDSLVPQTVDAASAAGHVAIAIVLDSSPSVRDRDFSRRLAAVADILRGLKSGDKAALIVVSDRVRLVSALTSDVTSVREAIVRSASVANLIEGEIGRSVLWDGVLAGASLVADDEGRPHVVLVSDGMDNASWLPRTAVADVIAKQGIWVDLIKLPSRPDTLDPYAPGAQYPDEISKTSGGMISDVRDRGLVQTYERRFNDLRQTYVLTYVPRGVDRSGWHPIEITVRGRRAIIKARPGYFASATGPSK